MGTLAGNVLGGCCCGDEIILPLFALEPVPGFAATIVLVNNNTVFSFANAANQQVGTGFRIPDGWADGTARLRLWLSKSAAGAGNARILVSFRFNRSGRVLPSAADAVTEATVTMPGVVNEVVEVDVDLSLATAQEGDMWGLVVVRLGADALDTYASAVQLSGVRLTLV